MRPKRRSIAVFLASIVLVFVIGACGAPQSRRSEAQPEREFAGGIQEPAKDSIPQSPLPEAPPDSPLGTLALTVLDQNKNPAPIGIPITIQGTAFKSLTTSGKDTLSTTLKPGTYSFVIKPGCMDRMQVASGGSGNFSILAGETTRGNTTITWRHRYRPWVPSFADRAPDWEIGATVEITHYVIDRCDNNERVGNTEYPTFAFRPSPNLKISTPPVLKSNGDGHGRIHVACTDMGPPTLVSYDSKNAADDQLDLFKEQISSELPYRCVEN